MAPALLIQSNATPYNESYFGFVDPVKPPAKEINSSNVTSAQKTSKSTLATVSKLDLNNYNCNDDLVTDIIESLRRSGGCIIRNMIQKHTLNSIESEIRPHMDEVQKADCAYNQRILRNIMYTYNKQ